MSIDFLPDLPVPPLPLPSNGPLPDATHVFSDKEIAAVNAALAARRPLLVRGEPGVGKSQLARAVAKQLGRAYFEQVLDARSEARDLLWRFDAVGRLAAAQVAGAAGDKAGLEGVVEKNFVIPGPLWWSFSPSTAGDQAGMVGVEVPFQVDGGDPIRGSVVLVDEIDKAEPDVPNGLLEALGAGQFRPQGHPLVTAGTGIPPLVIITTNEERVLPDAFLRRCVVLHLALPDNRDELVGWLKERGRAHFPDMSEAVRTSAAVQTAEDRERLRAEQRRPLPGQAEYLDLLRAVNELAPDDPERQELLIEELAQYVLVKHDTSM